MRIEMISAYADRIEIQSDSSLPASAVGRALVPLVKGETGRHTPSRLLCESAHTEENRLIFPRMADDYDLLTARFTVTADSKELDGVCYVTDIAPEVSRGDRSLPPKSNPIGTWVTCPGEDMDRLGLGAMMTEINSAWIQTLTPEKDDIPHVWNGKTYWFVKAMMDTYDRLMMPCIRREIPCLLRLINRFSYRLKGSDTALRAVIGHPGYEDTGFSEQMSAFNITAEEGLDMYCACVDFLCARYADPQSPLFCVTVMDVGNEINAQAVWHNCGPMPCAAYMEEYTEQLRLAHLIGRRYNAAFRADVSFDHHFAIPYRPDPLRYYPSKECLYRLAELSHRDGDFPWGISAHPYPEDLTKPDFYNDKTATFSFDTPRITMKNIEVWQALVESPELRCRDVPRAVVLDEQGFHTDYDDPESENKGAYAFVLLWQKMKNCPNLEQFLINRYADMPQGDEGGLHLGLRYERGYADDSHLFVNPGPYKRICAAIQALSTAEEERWIAEARAYVGEALFDSLLHPPR